MGWSAIMSTGELGALAPTLPSPMKGEGACTAMNDQVDHEGMKQPDESEKRRHRIPPRMTTRARSLRRAATFPERLLWSRLRDGQIGGIRFRRQHVIGPYVADFYCPSCKLVLEIDGHSHDGQARRDQARESYLRALGLTVVRFSNDDVIRNIGGILETIEAAVLVQRGVQAQRARTALPRKGEGKA